MNHSKRSPKGNRQMRRILNQAANAAVKHKGSIFEVLYRRFVMRLGHNKTIGIIAQSLCKLIWAILNKVSVMRNVVLRFPKDPSESIPRE